MKVVSVQEVKEVKSGLRKQDYIVGDATGAATMILWEYNTGALKMGASYKLSGMMVTEFDRKEALFNACYIFLSWVRQPKAES